MRKKIGILLVAFALVCIGITLTTVNRDRISESSGKKGNSNKWEKSSENRDGLQLEDDDSLCFYENGEKFTGGYKVIKNKQYYFGQDGKAVKDKLQAVEIDGKECYFYFGSNGEAKVNEWVTANEAEYYLGEDGKAVTGVKKLDNNYCKFAQDGKLIRKIDASKKLVAITYDDGPSIYTPVILDVLEKYDAVATFFVVGNRVSDYAEYTKRAHDMGCEIANHTYDHKILTGVSADEIVNQVNKTNDIIEQTVGEKSIIMRPPGGAVNDKVSQNVKMPMIIWSVDPTDWKTRNQQKTEDAVLSGVGDGDIVLMHDLYESTANAAEKIFSTLKAEGYEFVTVSELAEFRGVKLNKGEKINSCRKQQ